MESLAAGVPVITNPTSDIGIYVHDGIEGILVPDCSPEALVQGIKRILTLPRDQWRRMRQCSLERARESFDYRNYRETIGEFIEAGIDVSRNAPGEPRGL